MPRALSSHGAACRPVSRAPRMHPRIPARRSACARPRTRAGLRNLRARRPAGGTARTRGSLPGRRRGARRKAAGSVCSRGFHACLLSCRGRPDARPGRGPRYASRAAPGGLSVRTRRRKSASSVQACASAANTSAESSRKNTDASVNSKLTLMPRDWSTAPTSRTIAARCCVQACARPALRPLAKPSLSPSE